MNLNIEYSYRQKFLPTKRHRNARARTLGGNYIASIQEPRMDEFPVAFIVHDYKSVCYGAKSYKDFERIQSSYQMFSEEIRTFNGQLYTPIRVTHGAIVSTEFETAESIERTISCAAKAVNDWLVNDAGFSESSIIIEDNRKEIIDTILDIASEYLYFDGKFWKICGEPRYEIVTFGLGHNHGGTGFFIKYSYNSNIPSRNYFSAAQRREAIEYGKKVAANRGDTESISGMGKHDIIEVLMPEMVKVDPQNQHGAGDSFLNSIENIISNSGSFMEAGIECIAMTMSEIHC